MAVIAIERRREHRRGIQERSLHWTLRAHHINQALETHTHMVTHTRTYGGRLLKGERDREGQREQREERLKY